MLFVNCFHEVIHDYPYKSITTFLYLARSLARRGRMTLNVNYMMFYYK